MRVKIWDIFAIVFVLATIAVVIVVAQILLDPTGAVNPWKQPTPPPLLVLPTATNTPFRLPPTWTPTLASGSQSTLKPSSTLPPTSTGVSLDTYTPTPTNTSTPTNTPTVTNTPKPTSTPKPTKTPAPTKTPTEEPTVVVP